MKRMLMLFAALLLAAPAFAGHYVEINSGMIGSKGSQAPLYGFRAGVEFLDLDGSLGFWSARGMNASQLASGGLDLHVVGLEAYRKFPLGLGFIGKLGGGVGFTIPNLEGGASETADNGHSWVFGGGVDYPVSAGCSIGATLKAFFFTTDTHVTTYGSHDEILSNGQPVEVLDVFHHDDTVNFNSIILGLAVRWK